MKTISISNGSVIDDDDAAVRVAVSSTANTASTSSTRSNYNMEPSNDRIVSTMRRPNVDMLSRSALLIHPPKQNQQRWLSLFSSITRSTTAAHGRSTSTSINTVQDGNSKNDNDNSNIVDDTTYILSKSPSLRGGIWSVEDTITPMTSRPHFCTIQQVIQHQQNRNNRNTQQQQSQLSSPYTSWRQSESIGPVNDDDNDDINNNNTDNSNDKTGTLFIKVLSLVSNPFSFASRDKDTINNNNNTRTITTDTVVVETAAPVIVPVAAAVHSPASNSSNYHNNIYNYTTSPTILSSPNQHHRRIYNSGDMLLVPSLLSSTTINTNTTTTATANHTTAVGYLHQHSQQQQQQDENNDNNDDEEKYNLGNIGYSKNDIFTSNNNNQLPQNINHHLYNEVVKANQHNQRIIYSSDMDDSNNNDSRNYNSTSTVLFNEPITTNFNDNSTNKSKKNSTEIKPPPKVVDNNDDDTAISSTSSTTTTKYDTILMCIMYGCINAIIILPILISFGSIIYQHDAFIPYQQNLISLTLVSGIIHQISFSLFSTLPFAVGQVQDAGLIFLSSIASTIVTHCQSTTYTSSTNDIDDENYNDTVLLATVTVLLGCCTAVVGLALIIIGRFQLAQYVQLLPTGVVGGYLAFIGWFCGISGIGLMANSSEVTIHKLFLSDDSIQKLLWTLPGIIGGIAIYLSVISIRHMAVLPTFMLSLLVLFHLVLWYTGTSIQQATDNGWIRDFNISNMGSTQSNSNNDNSSSWTMPAWVHTWDYLKIQHVDWTVVPKLVLTELSMIFVVALSSSLDVAAIDLELQEQAQKLVLITTSASTSSHRQLQQQQQRPIVPLPLDYNHELQTVGISNVISGLTGGYTGSYIFSQSIFSLRAGIRSQLAGFVLAFCQFIVLILPIPVLSFVPNFIFGSLLIYICFDLMYEWLWHVRHKVSKSDYILAWITFLAIQVFGNVEYGIVAGIVVHVIYTNIILVRAKHNNNTTTRISTDTCTGNNNFDSLRGETIPKTSKTTFGRTSVN